MGQFFQDFIESVTVLLLFSVFGYFGHRAGRILASRPGMEHTAPAREGEVLTTGLPGRPYMM